MYKKYIATITCLLVFSGCSTNSSRISKVNEIDYPEGISVIVYNKDLKKNLEITNARLTNSKYKKQVQLVINNTSSDNLNIQVGHEWMDSRGVTINSNFKNQMVRLEKESAKRVILNAPNFKAKDVLINISCSSVCVEK